MRLNRRALRRLISEAINELTILQDNTMKVVELTIGAGFTLRHPELDGGEIVVDEMDEVAGALVALKGMGFTHVHSVESGDTDTITSQIQYFDDEIGGGAGRYKEYYPGSMNTYPVTTIIDDDDDDDDFI